MTRATILEQAYEMYLRREIVHGDERLSVVLDSLGYTTGAGYQIWPNQAAFRQDLQVFIAEHLQHSPIDELDEEVIQIWAQDLDADDHILAIGDLFARRLHAQEQYYLSLRFLAMKEDRPPEVTEALRRSYRDLESELVARFERVMEFRGSRMRDGLAVDDLAIAVNALSEGFALRTRLDLGPESVEFRGATHHPFAVAFLALVGQYVEPDPAAADRTADDRVAARA